jgi:hypothetical protein
MKDTLANDEDPGGLHDRSECHRLMLEAGADFGAQIDGIPWEDGWGSGFDQVVTSECCVS